MQDKIKELEKRIVHLEDNLVYVQRSIADLFYELKMLAPLESSCEYEKLIESYEKEIPKLYLKRKNNNKLIYSLLQKRMDIAFWEKCGTEILDTVVLTQYAFGIKKEVFDEIIASGYCICGKALYEDETCRKRLLVQRDSWEFNRISHSIYNEYKLKKMYKNDIDNEYTSLVKIQCEIDERVAEAQCMIRDAKMQLKELPFVEERADIRLRIKRLKNEEAKIKADIREHKTMIDLYKRKAER